MTQSGSPYDNAIAERVNGILKTELGLNNIFSGYNDAVAVVHQAIDAYNRLRPHMSISNLTPDQAHYSTQNLFKKWKTNNTVKLNQYYCENCKVLAVITTSAVKLIQY